MGYVCGEWNGGVREALMMYIEHMLPEEMPLMEMMKK
jgi:hypothetical protein